MNQIDRNETEDLRKLTAALYVNKDWEWNSDVGYILGGKRPFGNSSVITDVLDILGIDKAEGYYEDCILKEDGDYAAYLLGKLPGYIEQLLKTVG